VSQAYTVNLVEENVLRGNSAILKCLIPSFVTEYVSVAAWIIFEGDTEEQEIKLGNNIDGEGTQTHKIINCKCNQSPVSFFHVT
jgi:hypothetical protein